MNKFIFTVENEAGKRRKHTVLSENIDTATQVFDNWPDFRGWEVISIEETHQRGGKQKWEEMSS